MAVFSVDSDAVDQATAQVRSMADRMRSDAAAMVAGLVQLQDVWRGSAAAAFQEQIEQWRATQVLVDQRLDGLNAALGAAGRTYAETEMAAVGMFR